MMFFMFALPVSHRRNHNVFYGPFRDSRRAPCHEIPRVALVCVECHGIKGRKEYCESFFTLITIAFHYFPTSSAPRRENEFLSRFWMKFTLKIYYFLMRLAKFNKGAVYCCRSRYLPQLHALCRNSKYS